jgi:hypothetical protein
MCSGWRGQIPAPLGLHRVHLHYTIFLLHNTLSPAVHLNGSNGTAYTRPSMVQNKKKSAGANPSDYSSARDDQSCGQQTTFYQQGLWVPVHGPNGKTTPSVGVAKTDCLSRTLATLSSLRERNHCCIFSSSRTSLHS